MTEKHLTIKDILDKNFKTGLRGYNAVEVDDFLDLILKDYELYEHELTTLRVENARLMKRIGELSQQQQVSQPTSSTTSQANVQTGTTNYDILKRLSNLEKHVFGSKLEN